MKAISCDSSSIIALGTNCLTWLFERFDTEFWIPNYVKKEIVDNPLHSYKFGFEAMRNGTLLGRGLKLKETDPQLRNRIIGLANSLFHHKSRPIEIIQYGEADALALSVKEGVPLLVDEKNTRLLVENREQLRKLSEHRTGKTIEMNEDVSRELGKLMKGVKVIRSSELVTVAVKRGFFEWGYPKRQLLQSMLNALKLSGCAINSEEIKELVESVE